MPILRKNPLFLWSRLFHRCVLAYWYAPVWHFGHFSQVASLFGHFIFCLSSFKKKNNYHDKKKKKKFEQKAKIDPEKNKIAPFLSKENP
jgi:hypothetical protein